MKKMMILFLLTMSTYAQSDYDEVRISKKTLISISKLTCRLTLGTEGKIEDRMSTQLKHYYTSMNSPELEFDHGDAFSSECDVDLLDQMVRDSYVRFGHVEGEIVFVKRTAKEPRMIFGKCQRSYQEQIIFKLEDKLELKTSRLGKLIPATGCRG